VILCLFDFWFYLCLILGWLWDIIYVYLQIINYISLFMWFKRFNAQKLMYFRFSNLKFVWVSEWQSEWCSVAHSFFVFIKDQTLIHLYALNMNEWKIELKKNVINKATQFMSSVPRPHIDDVHVLYLFAHFVYFKDMNWKNLYHWFNHFCDCIFR